MAAKRKNNETKETTTKAGEQLLVIPLKDVLTTFENSRTGDYTVGDSEEGERGGQSFKELLESIQNGGQRTPVVVRPKGAKYELISGFRRYAAIKQIAQASGQKDATIKAIVKNLGELEAVIENVTENSREDLTGPDLMMGLKRIADLQQAAGSNVSDRALAALVGKNNSYVSALLRIIRKAPAVAKMWHEAQVQLGVREMTKIAKIEDPKLQLEQYREMLAGKESAGDSGSGSGGKPWIETAIGQARKAATMIGKLERAGMLGKVNVTWDEAFDVLGVRIAKDANGRDKAKIAKNAREAYIDARDSEETEESEETAEAAE